MTHIVLEKPDTLVYDYYLIISDSYTIDHYILLKYPLYHIDIYLRTTYNPQ